MPQPTLMVKEYLASAMEAIKTDAAVIALLGGPFVFLHVPEKQPKPLITVRVGAANDWSTKTEDGFTVT